MNVGEFLSLGGTDLESVVAEAHRTFRLRPDDLLVAVGSLIEGMGNRKSDLDLVLITPHDRAGTVSRDEVSLVVGRCLVDVRVLRTVALESLLERFETWTRLPWNVTHAAGFTIEERTLLHRLRHGRVLHQGASSDLAPGIPEVRALARLKLHVARHLARTVQVDMAGYRECGDFASLVFAAQELLGHAVDGLLAGYLLTNPIAKWRSRLLDLLPTEWERPLAIRPSGLPASELVWRLHRAPEARDGGSALEHSFRIGTFARAAFFWAEHRLLHAPRAADDGIRWRAIERRVDDIPLPILDFDVDFMVGDGQIAIARLNEFGPVLELAPHELAFALFFDGTTTAREAAAAVESLGGGAARCSPMGRVISDVDRAGFSVSAVQCTASAEQRG